MQYISDGCSTKEDLAWMNSLNPGQNYTHVITFTSEFHSPVSGGGSWDLLTWGCWYSDFEGIAI